MCVFRREGRMKCGMCRSYDEGNSWTKLEIKKWEFFVQPSLGILKNTIILLFQEEDPDFTCGLKKTMKAEIGWELML